MKPTQTSIVVNLNYSAGSAGLQRKLDEGYTVALIGMPDQNGAQLVVLNYPVEI